MTESNSIGDTSPLSAPSQTASPSSWKMRAVIGVFLSLFVPGLGQVYLRRPWRGLAFAVCDVTLDLFATKFRIFLFFTGMIVVIFASLGLRLYAVIDAFYVAKRCRDAKLSPQPSIFWLSVAGLLVFLATGYPLPAHWARQIKYFGAYRVNSGSMCPTICVGERIVVNKDAYKRVSPQRGDIIAFQFKQESAPFVKRVVGIEGDTVSQGPGNSILVNGNPIPQPQACGRSRRDSQGQSPTVEFCPVKVSAGELFVIGDDLNNSYDSRFSDFGLVALDRVRGKIRYIYWSREKSRIGCTFR